MSLRLLKASKRRKLSLDEINKLLRELPIKYYSKAVKTAKTFQLLKLTRKLQSLRAEEGKLDELQSLEKILESLKKVDQNSVCYHLAKSAYPQISFDNPSKDMEQIPDAQILDLITSNKKYQEVLEDLNGNLEPLIQSREIQLLKQKNRELNSQKKVPSTGSKQSAVKAIFVESLAGNEETQMVSDDEEDSDKRNMVKIQKQLRNNINRQRNRQLKEKQDLSAYMPVEERKFQNTKGTHTTPNPNKKRTRSDFSHADDGDRSMASHKKLKTNSVKSVDIETSRKSTPIEIPDTHDMKQLALNGREWKESGVHPSWAAKQAQKSIQIATGQGKKITFDD